MKDCIIFGLNREACVPIPDSVVDGPVCELYTGGKCRAFIVGRNLRVNVYKEGMQALVGRTTVESNLVF